MPVQYDVILGERRRCRAQTVERECRAIRPVQRIARGEEHRQRVDSAGEEDRDEDCVAARPRGSPASIAEDERSDEPPNTASAKPRPDQERPAREARAGGDGHPGSIAGRPRPASAAARRNRSLRVQRGSRTHQAVFASGDTATSWRSAASTVAAFPVDLSAAPAKPSSACVVFFVSDTSPSRCVARASSALGWTDSPSRARDPRERLAATNHRPRTSPCRASA